MRPRRPVLLVALVVPALIVGLAAVQLGGPSPSQAAHSSLRAPTISPNDHPAGSRIDQLSRHEHDLRDPLLLPDHRGQRGG